MKASHLSIRIPPNLNQKIMDYATQNGLSKTEIMIGALAQYFGCQEDKPLSQRVLELETQVEELQKSIKKFNLSEA